MFQPNTEKYSNVSKQFSGANNSSNTRPLLSNGKVHLFLKTLTMEWFK